MLKIINDLPENVIGISAEGKISASDYESIFMPLVEKKFKTIFIRRWGRQKPLYRMK